MNEKTKSASKKEKVSFEKAFKRLEEIVERLNTDTVSLDDSLKLYEEADALIVQCSKLLTQAESKIETLIKNRDKELLLDEDQKPLTEKFNPSSTQTGDES